MKHLDKDLVCNVIYLDNHLFVVEKPPLLLTQPNYNETLSLQDIAKSYLKEKFAKEKNVFLHPIHRLDKEAFGIVLFARTSKALSRLNEQMRCRKIRKKYLVVVEGILPCKQGNLVHYLIHDSHRAIVSFKEDTEAKEAILFYEVIKEMDNLSLLEVDLITGRYHQIRAQFAFIGHPIVGDKKYGSNFIKKGIDLQSFSLELIHPISKDPMVFRSKVDILKINELYTQGNFKN